MTIKATTKALLGSAVSFALLGSAGFAHAADLNNVSDDDLLARIERLEKIIGPGDKYGVRSGTSAIRVTLNGQVNQSVRFASDGEDIGVQIIDNDSSSTRFRILGEGKLNDKFSAGTAFEFDIETNRGGSIDLQNEDNASESADDGDNDFDIRRAEVFFKHKDYGTFFLGQGLTASDGTSEQDLSGTGVVQDFDSDDSPIQFRNASTGALVATIGTVTSAIDGAGRDNRVRYDTPTYAGFTLGVSAAARGRYDAALTYANKDLAGFAVAAGVGYAAFNSGEDTTVSDSGTLGKGSTLNGSFSVLHKATGLNIYAAAGTVLDSEETVVGGNLVDLQDEHFFYVQGGWITNAITDLGKTAFAVGYHFSDQEDIAGANLRETEGQFITAKVVQNIEKLSTELYARYTYYDVDFAQGAVGGPVADVDTDAIHVVAVGARIKF